MKRNQFNSVLENCTFIGFAVCFASIIFILDLNTSLGVSTGTLYTLVILYSWLIPNKNSALYSALVCSIILIIGYFLSPQGDVSSNSGLINRIFSSISIWVCGFLVHAAKQSFTILSKTTTNLENTVKERTEKLQLSELRTRHMIEDVQEYAIILLDDDGYIASWNKGAADILGYHESFILGRPFDVFFNIEDQAISLPKQILSKTISGIKTKETIYLQKKNGSRFWARVSITPIFNKALSGFTCVVYDLSLEHEVAEREKMSFAREAKTKELEQLTYITSHDLQEPLRTISSYSTLLLQRYNNALDEIGKRALSALISSSNRMSALITDVLDYSKIGQKSALVKIDTNQTVNAVMEDLKTSISQKSASLTVMKLPVLYAYENELRLLFQNILSNALKFSKKNTLPKIIIDCKESLSFYTFSISDNGIGIAPEHSSQIFAMFQRLHPKNNYNGTGIGLAHCKKIVELHKGDIWVNSEPSIGSTFFFTIDKTLKNL